MITGMGELKKSQQRRLRRNNGRRKAEERGILEMDMVASVKEKVAKFRGGVR